jgi:hypothetical protein
MLITAGKLEEEAATLDQVDALAESVTSTVLTGMLARESRWE